MTATTARANAAHHQIPLRRQAIRDMPNITWPPSDIDNAHKGRAQLPYRAIPVDQKSTVPAKFLQPAASLPPGRRALRNACVGMRLGWITLASLPWCPAWLSSSRLPGPCEPGRTGARNKKARSSVGDGRSILLGLLSEQVAFDLRVRFRAQHVSSQVIWA